MFCYNSITCKLHLSYKMSRQKFQAILRTNTKKSTKHPPPIFLISYSLFVTLIAFSRIVSPLRYKAYKVYRHQQRRPSGNHTHYWKKWFETHQQRNCRCNDYQYSKRQHKEHRREVWELRDSFPKLRYQYPCQYCRDHQQENAQPRFTKDKCGDTSHNHASH